MGAHQEKNMEAKQPAAAPQRRSGRKKRRSTQKTVAIVLASLAILLVVAAAAAWGFLKYTSRLREGMFNDRSSGEMQAIREQRQKAAEQKKAEQTGEAPAPTETPREMPDWIDEDGNEYRYRDDVLTILLMGIDNMNDPSHWAADIVSNGGNADVLALVTLNTETEEMSILYIPRDTMADLLMLDPEGNYLDTVYNNISASHSYGDGGALSCELTAEAVSNLLYGVPIRRYVSMNMEALPAVNQVLGGLEVTFPEDYTKLDYAFQKGETVRLTDQQLNRLIRYRDHSEVEGAYQRGLRDLKLVMNAMLRQVKNRLKTDPGAALSLYRQLEPQLTTNLSADEISYLAQLVSHVSINDDTVISMRGTTQMGEKYAEFYPDQDWLRAFVIENYCVRINEN
ncbi:MAG: LCP family protein [Oscillospiraceae bacterium]|nr:LCP family protein [Oscillospiraceae bacterium]